MKVHHLAIATRDPEALAAFYERVLGFQRQATHPEDDGRVRSVWLEAGEVILMLERCEKNDVARPFAEKREGFHLLAFGISANERAGRKGALQEAGVAIASESDYSLYFFDPDGNRIALSHFPEMR